MTLTQERRNYKRLPKESRVVYKIVEYSSQEKELKEARYKDVGGGGLLLETAEPYSLGTLFKVTFDLQGWRSTTRVSEVRPDRALRADYRDRPSRQSGRTGRKLRDRFEVSQHRRERDREGIVRFIEENFGE